MLNPRLYRSSHVYDFFFKSFGYERSLIRFLRSVPLEKDGPFRILDAGCGTGTLGLHFLDRFPQAELIATDLEPNFLETTRANAIQRGLDPGRITLGVSDISSPRLLKSLDGTQITLQDESIGLVCVGAVVGYAKDTAESLREMVRLLSPGGVLINLEMNESPSGRYVSRRYHYSNISISEMQDILRSAGCDVRFTKLSLRHLPAKLTRAAIIATKK